MFHVIKMNEEPDEGVFSCIIPDRVKDALTEPADKFKVLNDGEELMDCDYGIVEYDGEKLFIRIFTVPDYDEIVSIRWEWHSGGGVFLS